MHRRSPRSSPVARFAVVPAVWAAVALALAGACADNGLGSGQGRIEVFVKDDPGSPSAASKVSAAQAGSFSGTLSGDFSASISADGQTWVDLGSLNGITVDLQAGGDSATVHGSQSVPVGFYAHARLRAHDLQIKLNAGSVIGGNVLVSEVTVMLAPGDTLTVEKQVDPFEVTADGQTTLVFELNSESWVEASSEQEAEAAVKSSVTASAR